MRNSQLKKQARKETLTEIAADPVLSAQVNLKWIVKEKLRSIAEYDDAEVKLAMDTQNYGNELEVARAHEAIQAVQANEKPQPFYGATTTFMQVIHNFVVNNRLSLGDRKYQILIDYEMAHAPIVQENMMRKAEQMPVAPVEGAPSAPATPLTPATPRNPCSPYR